MTRLFQRKDFDWIRLTLIAVAIFYALFAGLKTVADFDLGWQLATGRYIVQHHAIPSIDVFSYTAHGNPWIYPPFSGVIFYLLFLLGGYSALSWLGALACVATVALILGQGSRVAALLAIIAVPAISLRTFPRADLFTTVLFAAFAMILWRHFEGKNPRRWLLPILMLLWVNLHTGFVAGLALLGAYVLCEICELPFADRRSTARARLQQAAPWIAASIAVTLVNPWGWKIYQAIARQNSFTQLHTNFIGEWSSVHFSSASWIQALSCRDPASADWWMLAAAGAAIVVALIRKEIGPAIVLAAGAYQSIEHLRFQAIFAILVCIVGGSIISRALLSKHLRAHAIGEAVQFFPLPSSRDQRTAEWILLGLLALMAAVRVGDLITDRYYLQSGQITLFGAGASWWFPNRATDFLLKEHLPQNVFSDYNLGGYLTWKIGPEYSDYFDGRFIPFGSDLFLRQRTLVNSPLDSPAWQQEANNRGIQTVIFSAARFAGLGNFPLQADCNSHDWAPVYLDEVAVIFVRNQPPNAELIHRLGISCESTAIADSLQASTGSGRRAAAEKYQFLASVASIDYLLSRDAEASANIERAEAIFTRDPDLHILKAQMAQAHNDLATAEREYDAALSIRSIDGAWFALAQIYASQHRYPDALHCLLESAAVSQEGYDRYRSLGKLYLLMSQPQDALRAFSEACRKSPFHGPVEDRGAEFNAGIKEGEAAAYLQLRDLNSAIGAQLESVRWTPDNPRRWQTLADLYQTAGLKDKEAEARQRAAALQTQSANGRALAKS